MDRKVKFVILVALAAANAGVIPAPKVLEGPSSKTTIIGPDGSQISAFVPGGKIVLDENAGPVLQGAPEVVAVAGVAQPLPVAPAPVIREVIPVVEVRTEEDSVSIEVIPAAAALPVESPEAVDLAKSAPTENISQIEATTITVPAFTEVVNESLSDEDATDTSFEEKVTDTPFSVVPLTKEIDPVAVKVVNPQPAVAYIHDTPFYVPEVSELSGEYLPEHLYEGGILGW